MMKDRTDNSSYDTNISTKIGEYKSNLPANNFGYYKEALYKTPSGQYFLTGHGGPESRYSEIVAGKNIAHANNCFKPLTFAQAKEWYEDFILHDDQQNKEEAKRRYNHEFK